jgi:signal transduction histidine kinase
MARTFHQPFRPVELAEVLRKASEAFRAEPRVCFDLGGHPIAVKVEGHFDLLVKAVTELCRNGLNALDMERPDSQVTVSMAVSGLRCQVVVRDNGCGMTAEQLKDAFLPFVSMRGGGTGLGLPATLSIIEAHRGSLHPRSRPGETVFTVTLPLWRTT